MSKLRALLARIGALKVILCLALVLSMFGAVKGCLEERSLRLRAETRADTLLIVNDSTRARLAALRRERDELRALVDAAKDMDGELVGGVKIRVLRDTIYVPLKEAETNFGPDSMRYAVLEDSTEGHRVRIEAVAPPYPQPIRIGYEIHTPEFTPEVGFVKRGEDYYAVVSWAGKRVETDQAFFRPVKERPLSLLAGAELNDTALGLRGNLFLALQHKPSPKHAIRLSVNYAGGSPYAGVSVVRKLW